MKATYQTTTKRLLPIAKSLKGLRTLIAKAGARHNRSDVQLLQQIHDMACLLGAVCPESNKDDNQRRGPGGS